MGIRSGSIDRHLPAIVTCLVISWLAGVCLYSMSGAPASARRPVPRRLVKAALGGRMPQPALEQRSQPISADIRHTPTPSPQPRHGNEKTDVGDRPKRTRERRKRKPARDLGHTLPVAARHASLDELKEPHHDYPALDLALDPGTKVVAVTSGRVRDTTKSGACGKGVILEGKDNFTYTYCHGSKLLVGRGRSVSEGQGILRSGNTGDSTGPHLHLQIRKPNGKLVCPQDLLPAWQRGVPKSPWEAKRTGCHTGGHKHDRKNDRKDEGRKRR